MAAVFGAFTLHAEYLVLPREVVFSKASHKEIAPKCYEESVDSAGFQVVLLDPEQENALILSEPARLTGASGFAKKHDVSSAGGLLTSKAHFRFGIVIDPSYSAERGRGRDYAAAAVGEILGVLTKTTPPGTAGGLLGVAQASAQAWGKEHPEFVYLATSLGGEDKLGHREVMWQNGLIFRYSMFEVERRRSFHSLKNAGVLLTLTVQNNASEKRDCSVEVKLPGHWGTEERECALEPGQKRVFAFYERRCDPEATGRITIKREIDGDDDSVLFEHEGDWDRLGCSCDLSGMSVSIDTYKVK